MIEADEHSGVNGYKGRLSELIHAWRRERTTLQIWGVDGAGNRHSKRAHISFAENAGVLSKVIDEHDVAVYIFLCIEDPAAIGRDRKAAIEIIV